jgi:protein TonB
MNFAQQPAHSGRNMAGISFVVLLHVVVIYALTHGMGRAIVEAIKPPLVTMVIEEHVVKPPEVIPPQPHETVVQSTIVTPEIVIDERPQESVTVNRTNVVPDAVPSRVTTANEGSRPRAEVRDPVPLFKVAPAYPRKALRDNLEGWVEARLTIAPDGTVKEVSIAKSTPRGVFDESAVAALSQFKFKGNGTTWIGIVEVDFKLQ